MAGGFNPPFRSGTTCRSETEHPRIFTVMLRCWLSSLWSKAARWIGRQRQRVRGRILVPTRVTIASHGSPISSSRVRIRREFIISLVAGRERILEILHAAKSVRALENGPNVPSSGIAGAGHRDVRLWKYRRSGGTRRHTGTSPARHDGRPQIAEPGWHISKQVPGQRSGSLQDRG